MRQTEDTILENASRLLFSDQNSNKKSKQNSIQNSNKYSNQNSYQDSNQNSNKYSNQNSARITRPSAFVDGDN